MTIRTKNDLKPGTARLVSFEGTDIAVFRVGEEYFAVDNHCPHQHFSKLHEGSIEGMVITCPMHGHRFDLVTGGCASESGGKLTKYGITLEGNDLVVES